METRRVQARLAYRLLVYGASIVIAALLLILIDGPFGRIMDHAGNVSDTQAASTGQEYTQQAFTWAPLFLLGLMTLMLIAGAVLESRRGR